MAKNKIKDLLLSQGLDFDINTKEDLVNTYVSCYQANRADRKSTRLNSSH